MSAPSKRDEPIYPMMIALIIATAFFMEVLDVTVVATAIPQMAKTFAVAPVQLGLGITSYILVMAVFTPISSWVADRFGARSVFAAAIVIFTFASILCAFSATLWQFVMARALQGFGGALMSPVGRIVQLRVTEKKDLVRMVTISTAPGLIAPVLGPPIGGFITTYFSWEWIFLLNVPIGALGLALVARYFPNPKTSERRPFDTRGFFLNGGALAFLLYGLSAIGENAAWEMPALCIVIGLALSAWALRHAARAKHPLVPLTAARFKTFRVSSLTGGLLLRLTAAYVPFVFPLLFQVGFGMSAFLSGLLFVGHTAGDLALKAGTSKIMRAFGYRTVLIANTWFIVLSLLSCAFFQADTPYWVMLAVLFVSGGARSLLFTSLSTLAYADVPPKEIGDASVLNNMAQQVIRALGISLSTVLINVSAVLTGSGLGNAHIADFKVAIAGLTLVMALALFWFYRLPHDIGAELSGHASKKLLAPEDSF